MQFRRTADVMAHIPVKDPMLQALRNGETSIDFSKYFKSDDNLPLPLSHVILGSPLRQFFINKVKAPLMNMLVMVGRRIPEITKKNTTYVGTHVLIDIFERFWTHERNPGRADMFRAAFKVFLFEIEHDIYYRDRFHWFLEEIIKAIFRGEWQERTNGHPYLPYWKEDGEYGGKYSIIKIMQNKKQLENLLGDKWNLEDK